MSQPTYEQLLAENQALHARITRLESAALFSLGEGDDWVASFLEGIPMGLVSVGIDGAVKLANTEAQRILGLTFDTLEQRYIVDFQGATFKEDGSPCSVQEYPVARCLMTGEPQAAMMIGVQQRDGGVSWAIFTALPTRESGAASHSGALVAFVEVTEMQRSRFHQQELERRLEQTRKLEALGKLAGGVAHDMNNILAVINGMAHVLNVPGTAEGEHRAAADAILRSCTRGRDLIRNLLGFARTDNHERHAIHLNALVEDVSSLLLRARPESVTLRCDLADDLPTVFGDPNQLANALMNLCFRSHSENRCRWIRCRFCLQVASDGREWAQRPMTEQKTHLGTEDTRKQGIYFSNGFSTPSTPARTRAVRRRWSCAPRPWSGPRRGTRRFSSSSRTPAWGSRPSCSTACSSRSLRPRTSARAPGWACRWSTAR